MALLPALCNTGPVGPAHLEPLSPGPNRCSLRKTGCHKGTSLGCSPGAVFRDVELVWQNCRSFNKLDSDICKDCDEAQQAFLARWQQQGLPQPDTHAGADKKKKGKQSGPAEATAAGKGGKKPGGSQARGENDKAHKPTKQTGSSRTPDKRKADAQEEAAAGKPSSKRKRGQDSAAHGEVDPSSSAPAQPKKESKGVAVKEELAPEKMSAGARLRKGLPPTPGSRVSPRMAGAEAVPEASIAADHALTKEQAVTAKPVSKFKTAALHQGAHKVKADPDPPVARRSSGRLK